MKRRIYWLIPDVASARRVMDDLVQAQVDPAHIHFAGPEGADMRGLHAANIWQTSDLVHAAESGLVIGSVVGVVAGMVAALLFPIVGDSPQWEVAVALAVLGGLFGAWSSSMIGISIPSPRLARFQSAIASGRVLLMVDLPRARVADIGALLERDHPEARFAGEERQVPAFP
ncbi:DUF1269 domain-containing protein [Variovorax soli]|uniref:Transmembrane protein n=1 Tax=Variovorax soli TaxID=376815 RepID=A0ABU1NEH8_9BURK|nr:DUF1269 domain-containing protein [Variovorax soli]MDR6536862.1 hypothetical protein [Variovorax soli]